MAPLGPRTPISRRARPKGPAFLTSLYTLHPGQPVKRSKAGAKISAHSVDPPFICMCMLFCGGDRTREVLSLAQWSSFQVPQELFKVPIKAPVLVAVMLKDSSGCGRPARIHESNPSVPQPSKSCTSRSTNNHFNLLPNECESPGRCQELV